ncbi:MAG: helix-turn-helix domain-containing protein [Rehaibacterium terrae]|uniref:AlbA family DNA-binding domain-containing protein n=1 Tax=Rehaibacterium terrae TaxID=1341696 RepID=UPI00391881AC
MQELLERLNLLDENERIEAKAASQIGKSLMETVCAFANEPGLGGGWLLLGMTREVSALFSRYEVQGLVQPDKLSADLARPASDLFNRTLPLDIQTESLTASQGLKKLRDAGPLQQKGRGSATWYQPTPAMLGESPIPSGVRVGLSSNPEGLSRDLGGLSRDLDSLDKAEIARKDQARIALLAELPNDPEQAYRLAETQQ